MDPVVTICRDSGELAARAADFMIRSAQDAVKRRGRFTLVLAGGATPEKAYRLLGQPERVSMLPWAKTYLFIGDERFVPPGDERSNFEMIRRTLLAAVPAPEDHAYPVPTDRRSAAESAVAYATQLAAFFERVQRPPRFDLILLGLGEDGHTASLFPGAPALRIRDTWVTWSPPGTAPPPVDRITLTFPAINAARRVAFLVSGAKKAAAVRDVIEGRPDPQQRPAAAVRPVDGSLTWLIDADAASLLAARQLQTQAP